MDPPNEGGEVAAADDDESLLSIDPSLLRGLSDEQRREALAAAAAARRAEERAEQRALERALRQKEEERRLERAREAAEAQHSAVLNRKRAAAAAAINNSNDDNNNGGAGTATANGGGDRVVFVPKRKRAEARQQVEEEGGAGGGGAEKPHQQPAAAKKKKAPEPAAADRSARGLKSMIRADGNGGQSRDLDGGPKLSEKEAARLRESYLGKSAAEAEDELARKRKKDRTAKKITFKFKWDNTDDTFEEDDPLYSSMIPVGMGRQQQQQQRLDHRRRQPGGGKKKDRRGLGGDDDENSNYTVFTKPIGKMTARDWRIMRESCEIRYEFVLGAATRFPRWNPRSHGFLFSHIPVVVFCSFLSLASSVKGGRAPPPLRSFRESPSPDLPTLHPALLDAIENEMRFREPTPIQRQAITIGLQRRDLIGIAETGSGKTVAFGVPLCHYLLNLPQRVLDSVARDGPLALVMAPTRELALQIGGEFSKLLSRQRRITVCSIVGGQPIQQQAQDLRRGVHIVVGTPGRINDCIEMAYLVLNQCSYIVLDEADR